MNDINFIIQSNFSLTPAQNDAVNSLEKGITQEKLFKQVLLGVTGCGKTFVMANAIARLQKPTLIIAHNKILAAQLYEEMKKFFPTNKVEYFVSYYDFYQPEAYLPYSDIYIEKNASINEYIERLRLSATKSLIERKDVIVVASVSAIYGLGDPENYQSMVLGLFVGQEANLTNLIKELVILRYEPKDEFVRGSFRVRGRKLDIFPAEEDKLAIAILFNDECIEKIEFFDALTNRKEREVYSVRIYPTNHYAVQKQAIEEASLLIKKDLEQQLDFFKKRNEISYAERLEKRVNYDLEMLNEMGYCNGIENYSRYFSKRLPGEPPPTLLDYLPDDGLIILDESHVTIPQIRSMYHGDYSRKTTLVNYGFRLPAAFDNRPLTFEEFENRAKLVIYSSATPGEYEKNKAEKIVELLVRPTAIPDPKIFICPANNQIEDLFKRIQDQIKLEQRILVTTLTKKMAERISEFLEEKQIKTRYLHSEILTLERVGILRDLRLGRFDVLVGINLLREGLDLPEVGLVAILDADKEGFLRSTTALIQTSGRAARNPKGQVVMYADHVTGAMQQAITEMERRRKEQLLYNQKHSLTPTVIQRSLIDSPVSTIIDLKSNQKSTNKIEDNWLTDASALEKKVKKLEKMMYKAAKALEFEKAAQIRDQIAVILNNLNKI